MSKSYLSVMSKSLSLNMESS